jgi:small-conductance mechanosensitive channel
MGFMIRHNKAHHAGPHATNGVLTELRSIDLHFLPNFRTAMWFGLIALAALIAGDELGGIHASAESHRLIAYGCAASVAVFGVLASRAAAKEVQRVAAHHAGDKAGTPLRIMILLAGYMIAAIAFCDLMDVDVGHLLIGGAITGIVVGLAAQPVLGNLFAGLVLLFARPYIAGEHIRIMSGAINGPHEGIVVSAGLLYTTLQTDNGPLNIPNSTLMAAAVGPAPLPDPRPADFGNGAAADCSPVDTAVDRTSDGATAPTDGDPGRQAHDLATAVAEGEAIADATGNGAQKQPATDETGH